MNTPAPMTLSDDLMPWYATAVDPDEPVSRTTQRIVRTPPAPLPRWMLLVVGVILAIAVATPAIDLARGTHELQLSRHARALIDHL